MKINTIIAYMIVVMICIIYFLLTRFSYQIILLFNSNEQFAVKCSFLIRAVYVPYAIIGINKLLQTYLMSQNIMKELTFITIYEMIQIVILGYVFIHKLGMKEHGVIPLWYIEESTELCCLIYLVIKKGNKEILIIKLNWQKIRK